MHLHNFAIQRKLAMEEKISRAGPEHDTEWCVTLISMFSSSYRWVLELSRDL